MEYQNMLFSKNRGIIIIFILIIVTILVIYYNYQKKSEKKKRVIRFNNFLPLKSAMGEIISEFVDEFEEYQDEIKVEYVDNGKYIDSEDQMLDYGEFYKMGERIDNGVDMAMVPFGQSRLFEYPELTLFTEFSFGTDLYSYLSWLKDGGGVEMLNVYLEEFGLYAIPFILLYPGTGGWSNKIIQKRSDFKGLKTRSLGLMGPILEELGAENRVIPGEQVPTLIESGDIDFAEWTTVYDDIKVGYKDAAKYLYMPSWQQPTTMGYLVLKLDIWKSLSMKIRKILTNVSYNAMIKVATLNVSNTISEIQQLSNDFRIIEWSENILGSFGLLHNKIVHSFISKNQKYSKIRHSYIEKITLLNNFNKISLYNDIERLKIFTYPNGTNTIFKSYKITYQTFTRIYKYLNNIYQKFIQNPSKSDVLSFSWNKYPNDPKHSLDQDIGILTLVFLRDISVNTYKEHRETNILMNILNKYSLKRYKNQNGFILILPEIPNALNRYRRLLRERDIQVLSFNIGFNGQSIISTSNNSIAKDIFPEVVPQTIQTSRKPYITPFIIYTDIIRKDFENLVSYSGDNNINIESVNYQQSKYLFIGFNENYTYGINKYFKLQNILNPSIYLTSNISPQFLNILPKYLDKFTLNSLSFNERSEILLSLNNHYDNLLSLIE